MGILDDARLTALLGAIEDALDPAVEERVEREWLDFWFAHDDKAPFFRPTPRNIGVEAPFVPVNDTLPDDDTGYAAMLTQQYAGVAASLQGGGMLCVRANYGVGILATAFGTPLFPMTREQNTLSNVRPLGTEGLDTIRAGFPGRDAGLLPRVRRVAGLFAEIARRYPKIGRYVHPIHPDLQSPADLAELIVGSDLFYLLVDKPDACLEALDVLTDAYAAALDDWLAVFPYNGSWSCHWGLLQRGAIMLRSDSAMNLSPAMYETFLAPFDSRLLARYGGCVHFCGRGDHYIDRAARLPGIFGFNLSQPELNDMDAIFRATADRGLAILGYPQPHLADAVRRGVHGWIHTY